MRKILETIKVPYKNNKVDFSLYYKPKVNTTVSWVQGIF